MHDIVIRAEGLGKKYLIGHQTEHEPYTALRDVLTRTAKGFARSAMDTLRGQQLIMGDEVEEFWALKDVSFAIERGEVVGIIGRNGAGKSTLLKILSRITEPSKGRVTIRGRVASLLEVGTGFHPELTGRENIYLNGAILGMSRAEIRRKFDEIIAFAEVERFLDTPVKRYSSGMYVRLAFAVAAHLEPEILLIDEVLAVGDAEFQNKCLGKMSEVAGLGRTVIFVSHNLAAIQTLCQRSLLLTAGTVVSSGKTDDVIGAYIAKRSSLSYVYSSQRIQEGLLLAQVNIEPSDIKTGDPVNIQLIFVAKRPGQIREAAILIYSSLNMRVAKIDLRESGALPMSFQKGRVVINSKINQLPLIEGTYLIGLYLISDRFCGDLFGIESFTVAPSRTPSSFVPYPASSRGIVSLSTSTSVTTDVEEIMDKSVVEMGLKASSIQLGVTK